MKLKIYKGAEEIGGNAIAITCKDTSILLDYGMPFDKKYNKINEKIDAVLISHAHEDHFGLINKIKAPIYCGKITKKLINIKKGFQNNFKTIYDNKPFKIKDFTITPYLMDHSAIDSYAFLIEADNKKIFYTGDFRAHGRKKSLFYKLLDNSKLKNIDVLLTEATNISKEYKYYSEEQVEEDMLKTLKRNFNKGAILISSSQNIDRLVSAFKAAIKSKRIFVIDIYTAYIFEQMQKSIPKITWKNVKVVKYNDKYLKKSKSFKLKVFRNFVKKEELLKNPQKYFLKIPVNKIHHYIDKYPILIYSMWSGYIENNEVLKKYEKKFRKIHASGHVYIEDLEKLINTLKPKRIIPIHTEDKKSMLEFDNVVFLNNLGTFEIN